MGDIRAEVAAAQTESESTRDDPYPADVTAPTRPNRRGSVVQSVRLPAEEFAVIEEIARAAGAPVSAMIRAWVLDALAAERNATLSDAVERLASDVERVRRLAARNVA